MRRVLPPYDIAKRYPACVFCPPQRIRFFEAGRLHLRPFVYPLTETRDPVTLRRIYTEDRSRWLPLRLLVRGDTAARISAASEPAIITCHLLPSFLSYLAVHLTLRIAWMILGETSLSFLGLGIRPPAVSWGALLKEGENIRILAHAPWLLIPGLFVVVAVLAFSFVGDGLRNADDPHR